MTTLESIFAIPLVFAMILGILQVGMWWYARQVALTAAQQGARAARDYYATSDAGSVSANAYLDQVDGNGGRVLRDPTVSVNRGPTTVTVIVHGHAPSLLFFLPDDVTAQSTKPLEVFVPAQ